MKNPFLLLIAFLLPCALLHAQSDVDGFAPAGTWMASCESEKLKFGDGYEICLITMETEGFEPGYFPSEFYYAIDYSEAGEAIDFQCADKSKALLDWGINHYFSFSFSAIYTKSKITFEEGSSGNTDYQLSPNYSTLRVKYKLVNNDKLQLTFQGKRYYFYRMIE